ncbi:hypothetical protein GQ53DRAFT_110730 [Thozetella sp. PMI_491]|nr:hypothetical protein GQ53DRAFT_110730 [Thozetella sp. PMI_491]
MKKSLGNTIRMCTRAFPPPTAQDVPRVFSPLVRRTVAGQTLVPAKGLNPAPPPRRRRQDILEAASRHGLRAEWPSSTLAPLPTGSLLELEGDTPASSSPKHSVAVCETRSLGGYTYCLQRTQRRVLYPAVRSCDRRLRSTPRRGNSYFCRRRSISDPASSALDLSSKPNESRRRHCT